MNYNCEHCNYTTDRKSNYDRHIKSSKHNNRNDSIVLDDTTNIKINNDHSQISNDIKKIYVCEYCKSEFKQSGHLNRHTKICYKRERLQEQLNAKNKENELLKQLLATAGNVAQTSTSSLNYLIKNFKNAPTLTKLSNYAILYEKNEDEDKDEDTNEDKNENNFIEDSPQDKSQDKLYFIRDLLFYHRTNDLYKYLGNFIIKNYKKDNPDDQSIWNSDTSRLTYIIRDIINNKQAWFTDKKGVRTNNYIIEPLLSYIKDIMNEFIINQSKIITNDMPDDYVKISKELHIAADIVICIDNKSLGGDIIRYIAPHFYLNNKDTVKLIESQN